MKLLNKISTPNINVVETTFQKKHFLETKKNTSMDFSMLVFFSYKHSTCRKNHVYVIPLYVDVVYDRFVNIV